MFGGQENSSNVVSESQELAESIFWEDARRHNGKI